MKLYKIQKKKYTNDKVIVLTFVKWGFLVDKHIKYDLIKDQVLRKHWLYVNSGEIEFRYSDVINSSVIYGQIP